MVVAFKRFTFWWLTLFVYGCSTQESKNGEDDTWRAQGSERGIHLPLVLLRKGLDLNRRREAGVMTGLGDCLDVSYSVLLDIGGISTTVLLDTGSSDLWVVADTCTTGCDAQVPLYPQSTVSSTGLDASLLYGDSGTGTYAYGIIGSGDVNLAGIGVPGQQFALINKTNAGVIESGSSGILGLGFPVNSVLWNTIFVERYLNSTSSEQELQKNILKGRRTIRNQQYPSFPKLGFRQSHFPDLSFLDSDPAVADRRSVRETLTLSEKIFQSYSEIAPFLGRLITSGKIDPMFTVALQRDTIDIGGNAGQLSIGALPPGIENDSLTWVPVRGYSRRQGGLPAPLDSPGEVYPISWEVPVDDVYLDGVLLPRSNLSSSAVSLSALIDTGNSLIRGPEDVIAEIDRRIGSTFLCSEAHILTFSIGGQLFPVDPRDFISQQTTHPELRCTANVVVTDPPAVGGYLFSWSLGTPFLKSVISVYYFGDLLYPSRDPPRIALISTVPQDAEHRLRVAVDAARAGDGNLPLTSEFVPSGTRGLVVPNAEVPEPTRGSDVPDDSEQTSQASRHSPQWLRILTALGIFYLPFLI